MEISISLRVATDGRAVLVEDAELVLEGRRVAEAVPDVGVLRDDAERLLLSPAADQDGDVAHRRRVELGPALLDARQRLAEGVECGCPGVPNS